MKEAVMGRVPRKKGVHHESKESYYGTEDTGGVAAHNRHN